MGETPNEFKLENPPSDGISAVKFGPNSAQFLLVSSWDTTVRLYDIVSNNMRIKYNHSSPVLDCCFHVSIVCESLRVVDKEWALCMHHQISLLLTMSHR